MSFDRAEKSREVEDAPKPPSQEIGTEVGESSVFDRIVTAAKQQAEVDPDLVPPGGKVSAAPKVSKTGVDESAEAIGASAILVAARLDATRARMASVRTAKPDEALGTDWQRDEIVRIFEGRSLDLGMLRYQLAQHHARVSEKAQISEPVRQGIGAIEHAFFLMHAEVLECRKTFSGIALDDTKLAADVESLDDTVGLSLSRKGTTQVTVAAATSSAISEQVGAIKTNALMIQSAAKLPAWGDDKRHVVMELVGHTQALAALVRVASKPDKARAKPARAALQAMFNASRPGAMPPWSSDSCAISCPT